MSKFVLRFRIAIYGIGLIALIYGLSGCSSGDIPTHLTLGKKDHLLGFWPPDLIFHPPMPGEPDGPYQETQIG